MRKSLRIASMVLAALLFFSYDSLKAQVKIGGNPATIDPAALLELESTKKGLLLPRVDDAGMTAVSLSPNSGFLVYYTGGTSGVAGLFVKVGTNMVRITEGGAGSPWKMDGNIGIANTSFLGTTNNVPLVLKANGVDGLHIGIDGKLNFRNVAIADPTENDILIISATGEIQKKTLGTQVNSLNGQTGNLVMEFKEDITATAISVTSTPPAGVVPGKVTITVPTQAGQATHGLMHVDDYTKLQELVAADGFEVQDILDDPATGLARGAVFAKRGATSKWDLTLAAATETTPGIVSISPQTFVGNKTFSAASSVFDVQQFRIDKTSVIGGAGPASLYVQGEVSLAGLPTETLVPANDYSVLVQKATAVAADNEPVMKVTMPGWKLAGTGIGSISAVGSPVNASGDPTTGSVAFETITTGPDFAVSTTADKVTFNFPDASTTVGSRGLVTAAAQSFAGDKTFDKTFTNKVHVGPAFGTPQTAPSSLIVNGSIGVKFRTMPPGGGAVGPDDYIVMVGANTAVTGVTLPNATECAGRIYVIKRIPSGATDDDIYSVVITPDAGQTINGVLNTAITVVHTSITLMSDGANWQLLSRGTGF